MIKRSIPALLVFVAIASFANAGVTVSAPTNGAIVQSPTQFIATASSSHHSIMSMVIYVDSQKLYTTQSSSLNTSLALSSGTHSITVKAWTKAGQTYSTSLSVQVSGSLPPRTTPVQITTTSLAAGTVGTPYSAALQATGGTAPYIWSVASGSLPAGLTLTSGGTISGTPTTNASYSFTVSGKDSASTPQTATASLAIAVNDPAPALLQITTTSVPGGTAGKAYSATLTAQGGTAPYTWSMPSGSLSAGLTLSSSGAISGTPTVSGNFSFTPQVKDSATSPQTASLSESMSIAAAAPLSVTATSLPGATVGSAYSATLTAQGGIPPYTWMRASGQLPAGLTLSSAGIISGTPSAAGTFGFTSQVKDSATSPQSATQAEAITASAASGQVTPPPQAAGYNLVFDDEFDTLNLSPDGLGSYNWYNPGIFWESPAPYSNITVANSILDLTWVKGQATADTSISTAAKDASHYRAWRYGYFEVRMKWDPVTGSWPAIWMIPVQSMSGATETGEIDIFEGQGATPHTYYGTVHDWQSGVNVANNSNNAYNLGSTVDLSQYHTYGALWVPGQVTWYFDNQPIITAPTYSIFDQQDYYLIIGTQEGANWSYGNLSGVTASSLPVNVDWVHVWQK